MADRAVGHRLAEVISVGTHPLLTPLPAALLILWLRGEPVPAALRWVALCALVVVVPLAVHVAILATVYGRPTTVRSNRHQLYASGIALTLLLAVSLEWAEGPAILRACVYAGIMAGGVSAVCNRHTKISLHGGVSSGIAGVVLAIDPVVGTGLFILTLAVGAARISLGHHTVRQVVLAGLVALSSVTVVFAAMGLLP